MRQGAQKTGASGEDIIIEVPLGTVAKNFDTNEILLEITEDQEEKILLRGGRGDWAMTISSHQQIRHQDMHNPANPE